MLKRYRYSQNMKQAALAQDLGVTQAMISRWESGNATPRPALQKSIRRLTGERSANAAPLIDWRGFVAGQPGIAAVIDRAGTIETASVGMVRETGLTRAELEGHKLDDLFDGDLPRLREILAGAGFFDEKVESAESADRYCLKVENNGRDERLIQGLHWPHRAKDGEIRWMLTGARVDAAAFQDARRELHGQVRLIDSAIQS